MAKWKGITFMTSRQGMGVGGGTVMLQHFCLSGSLHIIPTFSHWNSYTELNFQCIL